MNDDKLEAEAHRLLADFYAVGKPLKVVVRGCNCEVTIVVTPKPTSDKETQ